MFQRVTTVFVIAVALLAGGCTSPAPVITPKGRTSIPAQTEAARPEGQVHLFDEVTIHLPPIAKPGNAWTLVLNDERYLDPLGPITPDPDGGGSARFLAVRAGRRVVRFFALPPKSREAVPSQRYEIRVTIEEAR